MHCAAVGDALSLVSFNLGKLTIRENLKKVRRREIKISYFKEESIMLQKIKHIALIIAWGLLKEGRGSLFRLITHPPSHF